LTYRRTHCCIDVASIAHERLITKLKNQSEFTQIAYFAGENAGGSIMGEGLSGRDALGLA
jgi:hypothetical protein